MKKTGNILYYIFSVLFAALPVLIIIESRREVLKLAKCLTVFPFALVLLLAGLGFFALRHIEEKNDAVLGTIPAVLSVLFRILIFKAIGPYMIMKYDFLTALESAQGVFAAKEALFPAWGIYPRILSAWFRLTGSSYSSAVAFNIAICALSTMLVYFIGRMAFGEKSKAAAASLLFGLWPSYALYSVITTTEHLAIFNMLLASALLIRAQKSNGRKCWILTACAGIAAGLSDCFKEFSPLFLIAVLAAGLVFLLIKKAGGRSFLSLALALFLMLGCASATHETAMKYLESYLDMPVSRSQTGHFLWVGLNSGSNGRWTSEVGMKVYEFAEEFDNDYDKVNKALMTLLKEDLKANPGSLLPTVKSKMQYDWAADRDISQWVINLYGGDVFPLRDWVLAGSCGYYIGAVILILAGAVLAFREQNKKPEAMYFRLICFGFALLLVLSEAQGRYQVVLFPFFALLAAEAAGDLNRLILRRKNNGETVHADHLLSDDRAPVDPQDLTGDK